MLLKLLGFLIKGVPPFKVTILALVITAFAVVVHAQTVDQAFKNTLANPDRLFDVVVIGAGPAGLTASLEAAKQGARVLLVEQRGFPAWNGKVYKETPWGSRNRSVSVDADAVQHLQELCGGALPIMPFSQITLFNSFEKVVLSADQYKPLSNNLLDGREVGGFINLGDLEISLLGHSTKISNLNSIELEKRIFQENGGYPIPHEFKENHGHIFLLNDAKVVDLLPNNVSVKHSDRTVVTYNPLFTVVADGANSETLQQVGIPKVPIKNINHSEWLVATFKSPPGSGGETKFNFRKDKEHPYVGIAIVNGDVTTVYASPYQGVSLDKDYDRIIQKTAQSLEVFGEYGQDVSYFKSQVDQAARLTDRARRILIIGDAALKHDPYTGFGVSSAVYVAQILGQFLKKALASEGQNLDLLFKDYENEVFAAREKFLKQSYRAQLFKWATRTGLVQKPLSAAVKAYAAIVSSKAMYCHDLLSADGE